MQNNPLKTNVDEVALRGEKNAKLAGNEPVSIIRDMTGRAPPELQELLERLDDETIFVR